MWHETIARLTEYSDAKEFERLCVDILIRSGFADIIPRGPANQDGGIDATRAYFPQEQAFQFSLQRTWQSKLIKTVTLLTQSETRALIPSGSLVFVTNQSIPPLIHDKIISKVWSIYRIQVLLLDREWLRMQLDKNQDIRAIYLGIPPMDHAYSSSSHRNSSTDIIKYLSFPDFVRHLFTLAVIRRSQYIGYLHAYYDNKIVPLIQNPTDGFNDLLPLDRTKAAGKHCLIIKDDKKKLKYYPIVDQKPYIRGQMYIYGTNVAKQQNILMANMDKEIVRSLGIRLACVTNVIGFVSQYCGIQFRRLQIEAQDNLQIDYEYTELEISRIMKQIRKLLGKSWADSFTEKPSPEALNCLIEWSWRERDLELTLPYFLSSLSCHFLQRIVKKADDEMLRRIAMSLDDDRIPKRYQNIMHKVVQQRKLEGCYYRASC